MLNNGLAMDLLSVVFATKILLPSRESVHNGYSTVYSVQEKDSDPPGSGNLLLVWRGKHETFDSNMEQGQSVVP
jgi:hypothetical protein